MDKIIPDSVWPIIAYPSRQQFAEEFRLENSQFDEDYRRARTEKLGWLLGHHFLVPDTEVRNDLYLLQKAVNLVKTEEFQEYRARLYQWQDTIITDNISDEEALRQMHLSSLEKSYPSVFSKVSPSRTPRCLTMYRLIESYLPFAKHLPITLSGC